MPAGCSYATSRCALTTRLRRWGSGNIRRLYEHRRSTLTCLPSDQRDLNLMLSLFKRGHTPKSLPTFKERTEAFWDWYAGVAARFYETIEAGNCEVLAKEVGKKVNELLPGFAWVFGPGEGGVGHSFTLSGDGDPHKQLLALYWRSRAPQIPGWTFYPSRQPGEIDGMTMGIG